MQQTKKQQNQIRKKPDLLQNPQLTAAQMKLGRTTPIKLTSSQPLINPIQVMQQAELLWQQNDNLQSINLLKGLTEYLKSTKCTDQQILSVIYINLAVCYYKVGFLQQAKQEFDTAVNILKDLILAHKSQNAKPNLSKSMQKIRFQMILIRVQLQICILFSQMGNHEQALEHARISCKQAYNILFNIQLVQYQHLIQVLNKSKSAYAPTQDHQINCEGYQNLINNISILDQLINSTKDLRHDFISRQKSDLLQQQKQSLNKAGRLSSKISLDLLYALKNQNIDILWIFKNKILDQIQMKFVNLQQFETKNFWKNNQVIQKMVYLAISLYCYSTQTRFIEKNKQGGDPSEVLDSQHWLSRSLQIAYTFLPHEAPILNQILTVHDRFHGIDKQTIPQDKQVGGFFKVLRPLSKPKSSYNNKNSMCSPIMIRIQMPKIAIQVQNPNDVSQVLNNQQNASSKVAVKNIDFANKTIDLQSITKNNKIRGLNTGIKKYDLTQISQSTIKHKTHTKIDFTQNLRNIYASRKIKSVTDHTKTERMKINLTGISSSDQTQGVKSMRRPHSYDKQIDKQQQTQIQTERKRKSNSLKKDHQKKRRSVTSNSTGLKLDGLQMLPNPFNKPDHDDGFQLSNLSGRLANVQATKIGGNIFINNNINLFISKDSLQQSQQQIYKKKNDRTHYQVSKRQNFVNKRRAQNNNILGIKNSEFAI